MFSYLFFFISCYYTSAYSRPYKLQTPIMWASASDLNLTPSSPLHHHIMTH